jgi:predicted nucleic acid-binding protein
VKKLHIYVDTSVIGGCEDEEFSAVTRRLWAKFRTGEYVLVISDLTLQEVEGAPQGVRRHLENIPASHQIQVRLNAEAQELADAYVAHGVVGPGSLIDALHVAVATVSSVDVLVSWNFKHIVNLGRIRLFNAVNLEQGYGLIEIRTPKEVLYEEEDV